VFFFLSEMVPFIICSIAVASYLVCVEVIFFFDR